MHVFEAGDANSLNSSVRLDVGLQRVELLDTEVYASSVTGGANVPYLRGRALGGTTAINALVQMVGTAEDWNDWADVHGCIGWNWTSFRRELASLEFPTFMPSASDVGPLTRAALRAAEALGASRCQHVGETADGAGVVGLSVVNGQRADAFSVFVAPRMAAIPGRLVVHAGRRVREVAITAGRATGLVMEDDTEFDADAVVLSAGAVWSPIILRRSGVSRAGLGRNLKEHPSLSFSLSSPFEAPHPEGPQITGLIVASSQVSDADINVLPVEDDQIVAAVTKVSSVGHVHEVDGRAEVVMGSLSTDEDAARMLSALRLATDLIKTNELAMFGGNAGVDGRGTTLDMLMAHDDEAILGFVRRRPGPYSHVVGTCRMGDLRDGEAVVDVLGEVHGTVNLWVADASVFPDIPRAATQLPVMAVASRIARGVGERLL